MSHLTKPRQPKRHRQFVRVPISVGGLKRLAEGLNRLPVFPHRATVLVRHWRRMGILPGDYRLEPFATAEAFLLTLARSAWGKDPQIQVPPTGQPMGTPDRLAVAVVRFMEFFVGVNVASRLKRCEHCRLWFSDSSRNSSKKYCSPACTWRIWTRARRRAAGHAQYRIRGPRRSRRTARA